MTSETNVLLRNEAFSLLWHSSILGLTPPSDPHLEAYVDGIMYLHSVIALEILVVYGVSQSCAIFLHKSTVILNDYESRLRML